MRVKITRYDDKTRLQLKHYENLRKDFNMLIDEILGEDYYTCSSDVMNSDNEAFEDMLYKIRYLKDSIICKNIQITLQFVFIIILMILLFLASMHVIF